MSLIPLWVRLVFIAILCATCFASGFKLGVDWESNARDAAELKRVKEVVVVTKEIVKWRTKIETKYIDREVIREVEKEKIVQEVDKHVQEIPDPRDCWLAPERVRAINDAVTGATGESEQAVAVPAVAPAPVGEPQRPGAVGGGRSIQVPQVLRQIFGAGGNDQVGPEVDRSTP